MASSSSIVENDLRNRVACDVGAAVVGIDGGSWIYDGSCDWRHYVKVYGDPIPEFSRGAILVERAQNGQFKEAVSKAATSSDPTVNSKKTVAPLASTQQMLCCMWSMSGSGMAGLATGSRPSSAAVCETDAYALCLSLKLRM